MSAQLKALLPQRRNMFIVVVILFVLGSALGLYYFYYIPGNKQRLHQYGFRILSAITRNIGERNADLVKLYSNYVSGEFHNIRIKNIRDIESALKALPERVKPEFTDGGVDTRDPAFARYTATITRVKGDMLEYEIAPGKGIYALLRLPVHKLVGNILSYRHELFDNYLILKHDSLQGSIVYQDDSLGLDDRIEPDSILARNKGVTFSQITDVNIQGIQYKLFCFPFTLDKEHLVLVGMMKASDYRKDLGSIPVYLVYPMIILLLLIFISLPFLKIYLMGPFEQIRFADLAGLGLAIFGGVTIITTDHCTVITAGARVPGSGRRTAEPFRADRAVHAAGDQRDPPPDAGDGQGPVYRGYRHRWKACAEGIWDGPDLSHSLQSGYRRSSLLQF